ncbi:hypothetical protein J2S57_000572 [Kineosporia succinea]|uniref:Uncharacterized protein n=1 Tax=Kineosporia succinea TaxID=84632 RepID=A0ABT9NWM1_9ACTN|nr:hypothetical protein [Kineosporia succinea]
MTSVPGVRGYGTGAGGDLAVARVRGRGGLPAGI